MFLHVIKMKIQFQKAEDNYKTGYHIATLKIMIVGSLITVLQEETIIPKNYYLWKKKHCIN